MANIQFVYQRWFLKIICSGIMLPLIFLLQYSIAIILEIEYANFWYCLICIIIAIVGVTFFYKFTQRHRCFERKGAYWIENGVVHIQKNNKIYELKNVTWLRGTTVSAYGVSKSGMLVIQYEKKKLVLVSSSIKSVKCFAESDFLPLLETILKYNTELVKDDVLDFWYERKNY